MKRKGIAAKKENKTKQIIAEYKDQVSRMRRRKLGR